MPENEGMKALEFALGELRAQMERMHSMYLEAKEAQESEHLARVNAEAQIKLLHEKVRTAVGKYEQQLAHTKNLREQLTEVRAENERLTLRDRLR